MPTRVKDVMIRNVKTANSKDTVSNVAKTMNRYEIGCVVVTENKKPVGIVTERDILKRIVSKNMDPTKTKAHEIMSSPLVTVKPSITITRAARVMIQKKVKKLPVTNSGCLVGILSLTDLIPLLETQKPIEQSSLKYAPKRVRKVFQIYYDPKRLIRKNCPFSMSSTMPITCSGPKCMWFDVDKCIFLNLISKISSSKETN